jgi:hypothetical protein
MVSVSNTIELGNLPQMISLLQIHKCLVVIYSQIFHFQFSTTVSPQFKQQGVIRRQRDCFNEKEENE